MFRIAVQVQTVVPVCSSDKRKAVRSFMGSDKIKGTFQVFHKGNCCGHIVVKRHLFFQNRKISGFTDIGVYCSDKPQRIVVESASDIGISLFGQGLILVVSAAVWKLCGSNVNDTVSCPLWNKMEESQKVLAGITESHASADAGFIIRSRPGHIKGYHTLILVPDIHHAVYFIIRRCCLEIG